MPKNPPTPSTLFLYPPAAGIKIYSCSTQRNAPQTEDDDATTGCAVGLFFCVGRLARLKSRELRTPTQKEVRQQLGMVSYGGDPAHLDKLDPQKDLRNKVLSTRQKRLRIGQVVLNLHSVAFANVTSGNAPRALFLFKPSNHLSYLFLLQANGRPWLLPPAKTHRLIHLLLRCRRRSSAHAPFWNRAPPPPLLPPMWYGWCTSKSRSMHPPVIRPPSPPPR